MTIHEKRSKIQALITKATHELNILEEILPEKHDGPLTTREVDFANKKLILEAICTFFSSINSYG